MNIIKMSLLLALFSLFSPLTADQVLMDYLSGISSIEHDNFDGDRVFPSYTDFQKRNDGTWKQSIRSEEYQIDIVFTGDFEMLSSYTRYLDEEMIQGSGLKEIWVNLEEDDSYRVRSINKKDKEKVQRKRMDPVIDHSMVLYCIQAKMLDNSSIDELRVRVFNPYLLRDYEIIYEKKDLTREEILEESSRYNFPREMLSLMNRTERYVYWEGRIAGLASAIYPHKFHVFLDPDDQYKVILEWGADPKDPYFSIPHYQ